MSHFQSHARFPPSTRREDRFLWKKMIRYRPPTFMYLVGLRQLDRKEVPTCGNNTDGSVCGMLMNLVVEGLACELATK